MKTKSFLVILAILFSSTAIVDAQQTTKELKKETASRAIKSARKEARKYKKDGYFVAPGSLTMEKQLENAWMRQLETTDKNEPKYLIAGGNSVGETQTAAKLQAIESAKLDLAGQISSRIAALVESDIANWQLNADEATSVTKTIASSKNMIAQEIGRIMPLVEMYKNHGKNVEVNVRLAYNFDTAFDIGKNVIRKSLEEETKIVKEKLEGLMNLNKK